MKVIQCNRCAIACARGFGTRHCPQRIPNSRHASICRDRTRGRFDSRCSTHAPTQSQVSKGCSPIETGVPALYIRRMVTYRDDVRAFLAKCAAPHSWRTEVSAERARRPRLGTGRCSVHGERVDSCVGLLCRPKRRSAFENVGKRFVSQPSVRSDRRARRAEQSLCQCSDPRLNAMPASLPRRIARRWRHAVEYRVGHYHSRGAKAPVARRRPSAARTRISRWLAGDAEDSPSQRQPAEL